MTPIRLNSTSLNAAAYASQTGVLKLEFRSGAVYHYFAVPVPARQEFPGAESRGGYFNRYIRNRFAYVKIDPGAAAQPAIRGPIRDTE
jgi:hypothetical protein